ncbi:MAG: hypothetical protein NkDv07_0754 [Candidatus Improbicoccus devescovinae]|nr:MAG: hypothetical protein NkDv07_0754 [Candidatus Improbicoccus devescovinae]
MKINKIIICIIVFISLNPEAGAARYPGPKGGGSNHTREIEEKANQIREVMRTSESKQITQRDSLTEWFWQVEIFQIGISFFSPADRLLFVMLTGVYFFGEYIIINTSKVMQHTSRTRSVLNKYFFRNEFEIVDFDVRSEVCAKAPPFLAPELSINWKQWVVRRRPAKRPP